MPVVMLGARDLALLKQRCYYSCEKFMPNKSTSARKAECFCYFPWTLRSEVSEIPLAGFTSLCHLFSFMISFLRFFVLAGSVVQVV